MSEAPQVTRPPTEVPEPAPATVRDTRAELAGEFLLGSGIEIGALHLPMALPPGATVRYVDRMTVPELRRHYPELAKLDLTQVDVVDDGELLTTFEDESVDFIAANHFLEHCEDPIRTIATHLGKLRPGGVAFYAVPDKRYTFDYRRPRTALSHLIEDHEHGPGASRSAHYLEYARLSEGPRTDEEAAERAQQLERERYSIHFHVWTQADVVALMLHCDDRLESFEIEAIRRHGIENIVVLRKHGEPVRAQQPSAPASPPSAVPGQAADTRRRRGWSFRRRG